MSLKRSARHKLKVGYEPDVAACDRCTHFQGQHMQLRNSMPQWHQHRCKLHHFVVHARGCCDHWQHKTTGETFDRPTKPA